MSCFSYSFVYIFNKNLKIEKLQNGYPVAYKLTLRDDIIQQMQHYTVWSI